MSIRTDSVEEVEVEFIPLHSRDIDTILQHQERDSKAGPKVNPHAPDIHGKTCIHSEWKDGQRVKCEREVAQGHSNGWLCEEHQEQLSRGQGTFTHRRA